MEERKGGKRKRDERRRKGRRGEERKRGRKQRIEWKGGKNGGKGTKEEREMDEERE